MTRSTLSSRVVDRDRSLDAAARRSREALAEHRWHWTLDTHNPNRVTPQVYAREVNKDARTILDMVNGYQDWHRSGESVNRLTDYLATAKLRGQDREATVAVAQAKGIGVEAARRHHAPEVRAVKAAASERAARRGTSYEDEVQATAQQRQTHAARAKNRRQEAASRTSARVLSIEGKIASAMQYLRSALDESEGVEMTPEDRRDVADQVARLKAIANLLEVRLVGTTDVDWDAEMRKLTEGEGVR